MSVLVYSGGDMLKLGSQLLKQREKEELERLGFNVYSPQDDKEINDKVAQTEETNNGLAEKIFGKDSTGILHSNILLFEVDNNNVGATTEVGQAAQHEIDHLRALILSGTITPPDGVDPEDVSTLVHWDDRFQYFENTYFFHSYDVRRTNLPETGDRRSFSLNQYLYGAILFLSPYGIEDWVTVVERLQALPVDGGDTPATQPAPVTDLDYVPHRHAPKKHTGAGERSIIEKLSSVPWSAAELDAATAIDDAHALLLRLFDASPLTYEQVGETLRVGADQVEETITGDNDLTVSQFARYVSVLGGKLTYLA